MDQSRIKAQQTMIQRYGAGYTLQCVELKKRCKATMLEKYGVENIQQNSEFKKSMYTSIRRRQLQLLPIKVKRTALIQPFMKLEDSILAIYRLREEASQQFLIKYGFNQFSTFGKFHTSFGLVKDGILYQVIRFERHKDEIYLTDFGTREGYYITNYYTKLIRFATELIGIDSFTAVVPRYLAQDIKLVQSLRVQFIEEQCYDVFWIQEDKYKKLTLWDNVEEMLKKYDYFTTDYKEVYKYG